MTELLLNKKDIILGRRWFPLPEKVIQHPEQKRAKESTKQYKVITAGRRSYKTERFIKRATVSFCLQKDLINENIFIGAPTRGQAKQIFWDDIKNLIPNFYIKDISESELRIKFLNNSVLYIKGLEEYRRLDGTRWVHGAISEYQDCDGEMWERTLQPIFNDTGGSLIFEGKPFGKNHMYREAMRSKTDTERWDFFTWKSSDVLSEYQIESAKRGLALHDYEREYEASFETEGTVAYYSFSDKNVISSYTWNRNLPAIICCDFNAQEKPMSWTVGQRVEDTVYWIKSLSYQYTNTEKMCEILANYFYDTLGEIPYWLIFYGDYSGTHMTSNSSASDWIIIERFFRNLTKRFDKRIRFCKSIRDRIASTNALLCNALGQIKMYVHKEFCKPLIDDWIRVTRSRNGVGLDDSNSLLTHNSDSVDYYSYYEHDITGTIVGKQYGTEQEDME